MGASGLVGRLMTSTWANHGSPWHTVPLQYRGPQTLFDSRNIPWNFADGPDELLKWMDRFGALETLIVMAGVNSTEMIDRHYSKYCPLLNAEVHSGRKKKH